MPRKRLGRPPGKKAEYLRIAQAIRTRLNNGEWEREDLLPSRRQLARHYDCGEQVIRSALKILAAEERVILRPRQGTVAGFQKHLFSATSNLVALILANNLKLHWQNHSTAEIQRGLETSLGDPSMANPLLIVHGYTRRLREAVPPDLTTLPLSAICLCGPFKNQALQAYAKLAIKVVAIDFPVGSLSLHSICVDNEKATYDATLRLVKLGHRRIAFLRRITLGRSGIDPDSKERQLGFERACREAKLGSSRNLFINVFPNDTSASPSIRSFFQERKPYSAALTVDSGIGREVVRGARERGISIPRDLSLVCFASVLEKISISGPRTDFYELGRQAVEILKDSGSDLIHKRLSPSWREGKSIAVCRKASH